MVAATSKAFDVGSATLKITSAQREAVVNINASKEDLHLLQTFNDTPITSISTEVGSEHQLGYSDPQHFKSWMILPTHQDRMWTTVGWRHAGRGRSSPSQQYYRTLQEKPIY